MSYVPNIGIIYCPDMIEVDSECNQTNSNLPAICAYESTTEQPSEILHDNKIIFTGPVSENESMIGISDDDASSSETDSIDCIANFSGHENVTSGNNIHVQQSSDVLIGTKTIFTGPVVIKQLNTGNDSISTNQIRQNFNNIPDTTEITEVVETKPFCSDRLKRLFRIIFIVGGIIFVTAATAVAIYFLYLHFVDVGALFVCKTSGTDTCYMACNTPSCSNLVSSDDRPYISGHTTSNQTCKIYSEKYCYGDTQNIGMNHTNFYFHCLSARC